MRKILIPASVLALGLLVAAAKPDPAPLPPTLGVPHVVSVDTYYAAEPPNTSKDVSCSAGEVALSGSLTLIYVPTGEVLTWEPGKGSWSPLGDPPTGYRFVFGPATSEFARYRLYVTCAPVQEHDHVAR